MLRLRTKTEKQVPFGRGFKNVIIHIIIDRLEVDKNNLRGVGYYYYIDDDGVTIKLSDIGEPVPVEYYSQIENNYLPPLPSAQDSFVNIKQRLRETTLLNIEAEQGVSYGILPSDLEDDIE